jgi:hypothetical protein
MFIFGVTVNCFIYFIKILSGSRNLIFIMRILRWKASPLFFSRLELKVYEYFI